MFDNEYDIQKAEDSDNYILVDKDLDMEIMAGSKKEVTRLMMVLSMKVSVKYMYM